MSLGLRRGMVAVEPYNEEWERASKEIITKLREILQDDAVDIQHIGSTAIRGIVAKPIIDIAVGVRNFERIMAHNEELKANGIVYQRQDHPGQHLYVCGDEKTDIRTHFVHVVIWKQKAWNDYLNMRDYLNCHKEKAKEYSDLKKKLASIYPQDRQAYTNGKSMLIESILQSAHQWRKGDGMVREAKENDLNEILQLYLYLHEDSIPKDSQLLKDTWNSIIRDSNHHLIVCEIDGKIVASCVCVIIPNLTRNVRPYAFVENVVTHGEYRRKGYATACLNFAKQIAKENNCYKMMLLTGSKEESVLNFYRAAGYNSSDKTAFIQWIDM